MKMRRINHLAHRTPMKSGSDFIDEALVGGAVCARAGAASRTVCFPGVAAAQQSETIPTHASKPRRAEYWLCNALHRA
ncbi:MAG: hypothetical protein K2P95_08535, partial [Hyphomonadaceae bacterium]|nr:hypothetical protein [Hyphomonadaceae bacterium]